MYIAHLNYSSFLQKREAKLFKEHNFLRKQKCNRSLLLQVSQNQHSKEISDFLNANYAFKLPPNQPKYGRSLIRGETVIIIINVIK